MTAQRFQPSNLAAASGGIWAFMPRGRDRAAAPADGGEAALIAAPGFGPSTNSTKARPRARSGWARGGAPSRRDVPVGRVGATPGSHRLALAAPVGCLEAAKVIGDIPEEPQTLSGGQLVGGTGRRTRDGKRPSSRVASSCGRPPCASAAAARSLEPAGVLARQCRAGDRPLAAGSPEDRVEGPYAATAPRLRPARARAQLR